MFDVNERVTPQEITALVREAGRLTDLGSRASEEELDALRDWKVDVLDRIARDPGPFDDGFDPTEVRAIARRESEALRRGTPSLWDELS